MGGIGSGNWYRWDKRDAVEDLLLAGRAALAAGWTAYAGPLVGNGRETVKRDGGSRPRDGRLKNIRLALTGRHASLSVMSPARLAG